MKPSERGETTVLDTLLGVIAGGKRMAEIIAESTGCDEAMELLKRLEWPAWSEIREDQYCFICHHYEREGHAPDCRLAAYLKRYGGSTND